jgi:hypothetical protein
MPVEQKKWDKEYPAFSFKGEREREKEKKKKKKKWQTNISTK